MSLGISRQDENFKACLGLELRADDDVILNFYQFWMLFPDFVMIYLQHINFKIIFIHFD